MSQKLSVSDRTLVRKTGYDLGWIRTIEESSERVVLGSPHHSREVEIRSGGEERLLLRISEEEVWEELSRRTTEPVSELRELVVSDLEELRELLREIGSLSFSLPENPVDRYRERVAEELRGLPKTTEVERLVRERVGQDIFRESLLAFWGGACAVTGIALPELLRASHIKPWSECATDSERLNVYNGLLLSAHLDALFDRFLLTFDEAGNGIFAKNVTDEVLEKLGLRRTLRLRFVRPSHHPFLADHRWRFVEGG